MNNKKFNLEKWVVLSIPLSAIFSIFILELSLLYLSGSFIYNSVKNNEIKIFLKNKIFYFFCFFYGYILIRYLFVEKEYIYPTISILFYFRFGFYFISIFYFLEKISNLEDLFLKTTTIIFVILMVDALIQFFFGFNLIGLKIIYNNRVSSFFGDELILGSFLIRFLPFLFIFLILNIKNYFLYKLLIFLIILAEVVIFITGERSAAGLAIVLLIYYIIFLHNLRIMRILSLVISSILIVSLISFSSSLKNRLIDKTLEELSVDQKNPNVAEIFPKENYNLNYYIISPTHTNYIFTSINMFKDNVFFGKGPKTYRYFCNDEKYKINRFSCSTHPHNYYIQILAELGIVGLVFFVITIVFIVKNSFRQIFENNEKSNYLISFYGFFIVNLWPLTTTGNFFNNWLSILFYFPLGFYLYRLNK